jgi:TRAP-type C4-dicarboxylate transport system permease small subunit
MRNKLGFVLDGIDKGIRAVGAVCILSITGIILVGIVGRAFGRPIPRLEELTPDLFVWLTALGVAEAVRAGGHLSTDVVVARMPRRVAGVLAMATTVVSAGLLLMIVIAGLQATRASMARGEMTAVGYPAWWVMLALPVGAALALFACLGLGLPARGGAGAASDAGQAAIDEQKRSSPQ